MTALLWSALSYGVPVVAVVLLILAAYAQKGAATADTGRGLREGLPGAAWDHPVTVGMGFLALLVLGSLAYNRIPLQMMPSGFEPSFLWVNVPYRDASPKETDELVVRPIESQLATVAGLSSLRSDAGTGNASFGLEFHQSTDMDQAYNEVVDRLERAMPDLPSDVENYWIWRYNPSDEPIVWAGVSTPPTVSDPQFIMTKVVEPRLQRIPGVAAVDAWGVPSRRAQVDFDKAQLITHGLSSFQIQRALFADSFQMAGGRVNERGSDRLVRSSSRMRSVQELRDFPVADALTLSDVADVDYVQVGSRSINRIDGDVGAAIAIRKDSSANTVEVAQAVMDTLEELSHDPRVEGAEFHVFFSQGELIEQSVSTLRDTALVGGAFAVVILYLFLREWKMTLLITLSMPFSLLITVALLYIKGDSLNLLALMGLMLAVGMVVDNAIVVVETIYRRRALGGSPRDAAVRGTGEINLAIFMSTMTTMVVFLPIILMSENAGFSFFMGVLGFPVVFALGASLVVAVVFIPLATRYIGGSAIKPDPRWLAWLTNTYARTLRWVLTHRADAAMGLLGLSLITLVPVTQTQCVQQADGNINDFTIRFSTPREAGPDALSATLRLLEDLVENHKEQWGVRVYRARASIDSYDGRVYVYLEQEPPISREQVIERAKALFPKDLPGTDVHIGWSGGMDRSATSLQLVLSGEDIDTLSALADEARRRLESQPEVLSSRVDQAASGANEIRLIVKRDQLVRYGLTATNVGQTVAAAMRLQGLPSLLEGEREVSVVAAFREEDQASIEAIRDFPTLSPTAGLVPLRALTDVEVGKGPASIHREDRRTALTVTADLVPGDHDKDAIIAAALDDMAYPRGYRWEDGSADDQETEDSARNMALLLSITFVFLLMGVLFESVLLPMAVVTTIPLAMIGSFWGLYLTNTPLDMMAGVGLVILVGVIVNNGIVLVDLVTQLRREGHDRVDALVTAGRHRFRPIVMTALTTICGLIPMAAGSSSFIGIPYAPMGRIVMGGMIAGTTLTLLFVPWMYTLLDDVGLAFHRLLHRLRTP